MIEKTKNVVLVILVVAVCWLGYEHFHKEPVPEIVNVPQVTRQEVQKAMPDMSRKEVERTTRVIERTTTKEAPAQSWYSASEPAADSKAQEIAKLAAIVDFPSPEIALVMMITWDFFPTSVYCRFIRSLA